jgi:Ran GTPase-activating protein 1
MEAWSKFLAAHGTIKELRLYSNGIRQEGIEHLLLNGLSKSPQLQNLDLQDNTFTLKGAQALSKVISKWEYLQELGIGDCLLTARGGQVFAQTLLDGKPVASLEKLKLQYNEIEVKGLEVLIKAIEKNIPNLKLLELNGNRFADDDELVDKITRMFEHRGLGELDELDDMEEESEEEEEEEEEIEEAIKDAEEEENQNVAPEKSASVDALAEKIAKTEIE